MLNYIWIGFFLVSFVVAVIQAFFFGNYAVFGDIVKSTFDMSKMAVLDYALPLTGLMTFWLGIMNIGEKAGAINFLSRIIGPFFSKLFPDIPKNHPVNGQLLMNFSANMLGLDNAATPMGLKAMNSLQELNPDKEKASNAQIMFLALNTSGLTIIPLSVLTLRATIKGANGQLAADPTDIFIPLLLTTSVAFLSAIFFVGIKQKLNLFNKTVIGWLTAIIGTISLIAWLFSGLNKDEMELYSKAMSGGLILLIIILFLLGALYKKINVFDTFIEGAKIGFETVIKIIPYLVAMLVGIGVFRASGALDIITGGIRELIAAMHLDTSFVDSLPTAFMKPFSGSGAKAMAVESIKTFGPDSFTARLSCLFQGAADTTFYIVALYFGSVGIKNTRYAIGAGLFVDLMGILAAIFFGYLFFM
jgi:spore maturation protein SpmA/spore maturation protein SpmB